MGDLMEMTTWPSHRNVFYKMSGSGLLFEVKGAGSAAIGLARSPGNLCNIWVVIGHDRSTWIKKEGSRGKSVVTPNILTDEEYRTFWLSWKNGEIQLGRGHERTPIISRSNILYLCYITFSSGGGGLEESLPAHWRFHLPPVLEKPKMRPITDGELVWIHTNDKLPDGALIGGYEMESLYIIRTSHRGSLTPGKFCPSEGIGYIPWGGESHEKLNFEVLCGYDCTWVPSYEDRIPVGAVEAGYSEGPEREKLYVGRGTYCGNLVPGKVQPSHKVCYIPIGGREVALRRFEVLVSLTVNAHSANRLLIEPRYVESPLESESDENEPEEEHPYEADVDVYYDPINIPQNVEEYSEDEEQ